MREKKETEDSMQWLQGDGTILNHTSPIGGTKNDSSLKKLRSYKTI